MKNHIRMIIALTIILAACCSSAAISAGRANDGFEYNTVKELQNKWSILNSGFTKPLDIELTTKNVKEGKKALLLKSYPVGETTSTRIDLDITPDIPLKDVRQIRFWVWMDNPQSLAQTGIHCGDSTWTNHFSKFGYMGFSKGWQRVFVSTESLVVGGGNPSWETATQMRLTFWFTSGAPATKIILDDISWSTTRERDRILNKKWYD